MSKTLHPWILATTGALLLSLTPALVAAKAHGNAAPAQPGSCAPEVERLCRGVKPGAGRIVKCLNSHTNDLGPQCKERLAAVRAAVAEAKEECADDVEAHCAAVKPGHGRVVHCLQQQKAALSMECREHVDKAYAAMMEARARFNKACDGDSRKYCKGVKPGKSRIWKCLEQHEAELAPACKAEFNRKK